MAKPSGIPLGLWRLLDDQTCGAMVAELKFVRRACLSHSIAANGIAHSGADFSANPNLIEPGTNRIRIILIDEHTILRQALRMFFKTETDFEIVGEASDQAGAIDVVSRMRPDIILLDRSVGEVNNYRIIPELLAADENARVIILSGERDIKAHRDAMILGARGVVPKQHPVETLIEAIKKVFTGEVWVESATASSLLAEMVNNARGKRLDPETLKVNSLSRRECEVVALVATGLKNRQIAERLFITEATVSHHLTSIFNKLDIPDRLQLIVYAHKRGLTMPDG
jgi:two-component system response regulator DegU